LGQSGDQFSNGGILNSILVIIVIIADLVLVGTPAAVHISVIIVLVLREHDDQIVGSGPL
jgi:hypothetical protein